MKIKKGDTVKVISGKHKGSSSEVVKALKVENKVLLKGVNKVIRHIKKQGDQEGGRISVEKPIDASKVVFVCPLCKKESRLGYKFTDKGKKVRFCKKCKKEV